MTTTTLTHASGKERKQLRTEKKGSEWTTTQWGQWKDDDWAQEHRADQTWGRSEAEADKQRESWTKELQQLGWK